MYSILKMQENRSLTFWERVEKFVGDPNDPRVFIEILYDPLSNYLIYRDNNKEQQLKKDLIRGLFLFADIRDRSSVFNLPMKVVHNRIMDFIILAQKAGLDMNLIIGPEAINDQNLGLVLKEYFPESTELKQVVSLISHILSEKAIIENF